MGSSEEWLWVCTAAPVCFCVLGGGTHHDFIMLSSAKSNKFYLFSWAIGVLVMSVGTCQANQIAT